MKVVAKLLGHSTTKITQHYAKPLKNSILGEVKDAFEMYNLENMVIVINDDIANLKFLNFKRD